MEREEGRRHELGGVLAEFTQSVALEHTAAKILRRLGDYCTDLLRADAIGVLVRNDQDGLEVGTADSDPGRRVEELEVSLGEGPCAESLRDNHQVLASDLAGDLERWPRFAPQAIDAGIRAIHALPMSVRGTSFAVVDVMFAEPTELDGMTLTAGQLLADVAAAYLANANALRESTRLNEQLQRALDRRVLIEQAKGVLAERRTIGVNEAFDVMRAYARDHNAKLGDVATRIIRGETDL